MGGGRGGGRLVFGEGVCGLWYPAAEMVLAARCGADGMCL